MELFVVADAGGSLTSIRRLKVTLISLRLRLTKASDPFRSQFHSSFTVLELQLVLFKINPCVCDSNPVGGVILGACVGSQSPETVTPRKEACLHERLVLQLPNWVVLRKPDPPVASAHLWRDAVTMHARMRTL